MALDMTGQPSARWVSSDSGVEGGCCCCNCCMVECEGEEECAEGQRPQRPIFDPALATLQH